MNRLYLALFILFTSVQFTIAQIDTTIVMDDLVVNGNRISTPFSEASRNIQIVTKEDIRTSPVQSIPEILSYSPAVDIRQRGPMGVQSDIGIRGGSFEQTLILLNGIKMTDPQTGHHIMSLPVPLDQIDQIEILKGPGARIYGQNAFAGAINFISRPSGERKINLRSYGGSFGSFGGNLSISLPSDESKTLLSLSADRSNGYRHNTDYKILNGFIQHDYELEQGELNFMFGLSDRKFGASGFYASPDFTEQYEEVRTSIASIAYQGKFGNLMIKPRLYWRSNRDNYLFVRDNPGAYRNLHETNTYGVEFNSTYQNQFGTTGLGIEFRKETINGDWVRSGNWSKSNLDGFGRDNFGIYLDHRLKLGSKLDLTPGVYVNWYSDFGWNAFPGLDMGYNVNDEVRLYGNVGRSYRIPTFYDQYYSSPVEQGNPDLQPEEALTYEIGLRYMKNGISLEGNYFVRDASQLIDWVYNTNDSLWRSQNFQDVLTNGIELVVDFDLNQLISNKFPLDRIQLSYNYLDQNINEIENVQSRYALEHIQNQMVLGFNMTIIGKLKNTLKVRYIDRIEQDPYFLLDDRLFYEHDENLNIFIEAINLTNQQYTEVMTLMPGIWVRFGLSLQMGY